MAGSMTTMIGYCFLFLSMAASTTATIYTVGDATGWSTGVDYSTWTSDKTFLVGDSLVFNYGGGLHSVAEVSPSDYSACTAGNSITSDSSGATTVALKTEGTHYFICGVIGHCSQGMKLAVKVGGAAAGGSPSTPGTGSPAGTPSTTTPTPTSTNSSSAAPVAPFMAIFLCGVALFMLPLP